MKNKQGQLSNNSAHVFMLMSHYILCPHATCTGVGPAWGPHSCRWCTLAPDIEDRHNQIPLLAYNHPPLPILPKKPPHALVHIHSGVGVNKGQEHVHQSPARNKCIPEFPTCLDVWFGGDYHSEGSIWCTKDNWIWCSPMSAKQYIAQMWSTTTLPWSRFWTACNKQIALWYAT